MCRAEDGAVAAPAASRHAGGDETPGEPEQRGAAATGGAH